MGDSGGSPRPFRRRAGGPQRPPVRARPDGASGRRPLQPESGPPAAPEQSGDPKGPSAQVERLLEARAQALAQSPESLRRFEEQAKGQLYDLVGLQGPRSFPLLRALLTAREHDAGFQNSLLSMLQAHPSESLVQFLSELLERNEIAPAAKSTAIASLGHLATKMPAFPAGERLISQLQGLHDRLLGDPDEAARAAAFGSYFLYRPLEALPGRTVGVFRKGMLDSSPLVLQVLCNTLRSKVVSGDEALAVETERALDAARDDAHRLAAFRVLLETRVDRARGPVLAGLSSPQVDLRRYAVLAAAALRMPEAVEGLAALLDAGSTADPALRSQVVKALSEIGTEAAAGALLDRFGLLPSAEERAKVAATLAGMDACAGKTALGAQLIERFRSEPDPGVRHQLLGAMGRNGTPGTLDWLSAEYKAAQDHEQRLQLAGVLLNSPGAKAFAAREFRSLLLSVHGDSVISLVAASKPQHFLKELPEVYRVPLPEDLSLRRRVAIIQELKKIGTAEARNELTRIKHIDPTEGVQEAVDRPAEEDP